MNVNTLKKDRAAALDQAQALMDATDAEHRSLTTDEEGKYDALLAEADRLAANIKRVERLSNLTPEERGAVNNQRPALPAGSGAPETRYASLGEQMIAAYRAEKNHASDPRLSLTPEERAVSGMNETIPSEGGTFVQPEFSSELLARAYETGVLASECRQIPMQGNQLTINGVDETSRATGSRWGGVQSYWQAEADAMTATKPKFRKIVLTLKKLTGLCYLTDELMADAPALEAVVRQAFAEEFGFQMDDAIIRGGGAGNPLGILNSPSLISVAKETGQDPASIVYENVQKMYSRCWARSMQNAKWYINQDTLPQLFSMSLKIGTAGAPVFLPPGGATGSPYSTLFTRPVVPIEQCETVGSVGDIILADFSQYVLGTKGPAQTAVSMHVRFLNDETVIRFIIRLDGQPIWHKALTPYKGSNTLSPFVALAAR